jgi:23S rRNA-/tRNA-specific pseudouridylate synthase
VTGFALGGTDACRQRRVAITDHRRTFGKIALLEMTLGRKYRIRVQPAAIGDPIVGNPKYDDAIAPAQRSRIQS